MIRRNCDFRHVVVMQEMNIGLVSDEYHHTILISYISSNEQHLLHPPPFRHRITRQSGAVVNGSGLLHRACLRTGRTWASLVVFMSDRFRPRTERRGRENRTTISACIGQRAVGVTRVGVPARGPRTSESRRRGRRPRMAPKGPVPRLGILRRHAGQYVFSITMYFIHQHE